MKSKVYFISAANSDSLDAVKLKISRLLGESRVLEVISPGDKVALKIHFGEEANTGYIRPEYARIVAQEVSRRQARPVFCDTNTLYRGRRMNSEDHLKLAWEHGYSPEAMAAEIFIPDDSREGEVTSIAINHKFVKTAKIASYFLRADAIVGLAHFKGHIMAGFAGALKNLGMGCASRDGKLAQHSDVSPFVREKICVGCGECEKACPAKAIVIANKKSCIDSGKCIGCASCIAACVYHAIDVKWEQGGDKIQQKMVEYAKAALTGKKTKCAFLNFALKITKECDCIAKDDPRIAPDIGILASLDPVSIDKASLDLVVKACGKDVFRQVHPDRDGMRQLKYASGLGLGNLEYELIEL